jgi:hypothetical protein
MGMVGCSRSLPLRLYIGRRRATPKLALDRSLVKAVRGRTARRPTGGALDGLTRTVEPSPHRIDGAAPVVKMAEEKKERGSVSHPFGQDVVDGLGNASDGAQGSA